MGWFGGGDKHTGWKDSSGRPVTDKQAKRISNSTPKNAPKSGKNK